MKIYSYIVNHDTGFAPNPFYGYCTLANCKPKIRKTAEIGDLIFGLSCKARNNYLIYAMKVMEANIQEYFFRYRTKHLVLSIQTLNMTNSI